jgi:hypothetical protein
MPDAVALITAVLLERPLCVDCLRTKSGLTEQSEIADTLRRIQRVLLLRYDASGRCHACGEAREVFSLERPT